MRKIAFINAKGGVAKTTSCVNIGAGLALGGYRTLLIDLDSQGQVTKSLGVQAGEGLAELLQGDAGLGDVQIEAIIETNYGSRTARKRWTFTVVRR